jgi:Protein of unknown function (DUF2934)
MRELQNEIRERAYHLWIADGRHHGDADAYWLKAEKEILSIAALRLVKHKTARAAKLRRKAA